MAKFIEKTGVGVKEAGNPLTASDINSINETLNDCVDSVNEILKFYYDLGVEINDFKTTFTLEQAVNLVPIHRRFLGMRLRFLSEIGVQQEYHFSGNTIEEEDWKNLNNWNLGLGLEIDGGEW